MQYLPACKLYVFTVPAFLPTEKATKSVKGGKTKPTEQSEGEEDTEIVKNFKGGRGKGERSDSSKKSAKGKGKLDSGDATRTLELLMSAKVCGTVIKCMCV